MKIQIDTTEKVIRIEDRVNLKQLSEFIKNIPGINWEEFDIEVQVIQNWTSPIIIENPYSPHAPYPWETPIIYGTSDTTSGDQGIMNFYIN